MLKYITLSLLAFSIVGCANVTNNNITIYSPTIITSHGSSGEVAEVFSPADISQSTAEEKKVDIRYVDRNGKKYKLCLDKVLAEERTIKINPVSEYHSIADIPAYTESRENALNAYQLLLQNLTTCIGNI